MPCLYVVQFREQDWRAPYTGAASDVLRCGGGFGSQWQSTWGCKGGLALLLPWQSPSHQRSLPESLLMVMARPQEQCKAAWAGVSSVFQYGLGLYLSTSQLYLSTKYVLGKAQKCIFLEIISICTSQRIYWFSYTPEIRVETLYSREADTCAAYQSYTYGTKDSSVESNQLYLHQHTTCSVIL